MLCFKDLQDEVKRRSVRNQAGTAYDDATKNLINLSLLRISNETNWRQLRRYASINTVASFTTGTVDATEDSTTLSFTGANLITNGVHIGRRIKLSGSSTLFRITAITDENTATINLGYDQDTETGMTFTIYGQEEYNLPIQTSKPVLLWHEANGYPQAMSYIPERQFIEMNIDFDEQDYPEAYRMWGEDCVINQPRTASVISAVSSSVNDTAVEVTIFGTVSGYPDYDVIAINGTTSVSTTKSFTNIERISKDNESVGRITLTADSGNTSIAVLPVGDAANSYLYKKIQIFPTPDAIYEIRCAYYKDIQRLVEDDDIHELGQDFDEAIILLAVSKLQGEESKRDVATFYQMFQDELKILKRKNADKLDWLPTLFPPTSKGTPAFHKWGRYSQVGSKYGPRV
jgi:hypothetical protein